MIGYERNSDRIPGTFYAPVIRNTNRWQWAVTLLQNDASTTTRSVSWYVWSLFAHHPISHTLPTNADFGPLYYIAGKDDSRNAMVWKGAVFNTTNSADVPVSVKFEGVQPGTQAALTILTNPGGDPYAVNDPATGVNIVETTTQILTASSEGVFEFSMSELSVAVLDTCVDCKQMGSPASGTAPEGNPVQQIGDGQIQQPTGSPVTQIADGQIQVPTGASVTQIADGQIQVPTGAPVTQIADGQIQAPTGVPVTQISDGQIQAPTGSPVMQISDGQIQQPTAYPAKRGQQGRAVEFRG